MPAPHAPALKPETRLRAILTSLRRALAIGISVGLLLRVTGLFPDLGGSLLVSVLFSTLIVGGFHLASPWVEWTPSEAHSPFRQALGNTLRVLALYTFLVFLGGVLVRLSLGLDLFAQKADALLTYFIGLTITSVISGLHMAENLVSTERARNLAERETFRLHLVEADHARKTEELEEARRLQLSMLPRTPPAWDGLRFAHHLETATEVGGDTYDHRRLPDGTLLVAFGDATGHGLQAGLMVTAFKALFHALPAGVTLAEAMAIISQGIRGLHLPRMAMALVLLQFDGDRVLVCNAGMPPLLHGHAADGTQTLHRASGPPLGQLRDFIYAEASCTLAPGDSMLLCSDGFPECMDPEDRMLGYGRMEALGLLHGRQDPEAVLRSLREEAQRWARGRPLADDLSFLAIGPG